MPALPCPALPSVRATGGVCVKFDIRDFYENLYERNAKWLKLDNNVGYHTWRLMHVHIVEKYTIFHT
jgi:hypothetical protein